MPQLQQAEHHKVVNSVAGDHCGLPICLYPWPCPGELARRADVVRALHPVEGYCPLCGEFAPCGTRRAVDGTETTNV